MQHCSHELCFALLRFQFYLLNLFKDYAGEQLALVLRVSRGSSPRGEREQGKTKGNEVPSRKQGQECCSPLARMDEGNELKLTASPATQVKASEEKRAGECSLAKGRKARDVTRETFLSPPDDAFAASPPLHRCFSSSWMSERAKRPPLSTLLLVLLPLSPKRSHSLPLHLTREVGGGEREQSSACLLACLCVL